MQHGALHDGSVDVIDSPGGMREVLWLSGLPTLRGTLVIVRRECVAYFRRNVGEVLHAFTNGLPSI